MWRGNILAPDQPTNHHERLKPLAAALAEAGVDTSPLVYFDADVGKAREQLLASDGVMVWINPVQDGQDRKRVDALLKDVAAAGVWVSAHPDTILKMGTKEVLYATQALGWGADTDIYRSLDELKLRFPVKLAVAGARVLKPLRGNDGRGVLKVETFGRDLRIQSASDDRVEVQSFAGLAARLADVFAGGGMIDQAFNPNVSAGMVRCYMSQDRVAGFSEQAPRNLRPDENLPQFGMNSAKTMHGADASAFAALRRVMEEEWTPGLQRILGLATPELPALWDADFLYRPVAAGEAPSFMLCEINVSSVSPFPDAAARAIAATVSQALRSRT
jgi:hypothetical protein